MLTTAKRRFFAFAMIVLALPTELMATDHPRLIDLGKLAMILAPGPVGLLLNRELD